MRARALDVSYVLFVLIEAGAVCISLAIFEAEATSRILFTRSMFSELFLKDMNQKILKYVP